MISDSLISVQVSTVMGVQFRKNCIVGMIRLLTDDPTFIQAQSASWYPGFARITLRIHVFNSCHVVRAKLITACVMMMEAREGDILKQEEDEELLLTVCIQLQTLCLKCPPHALCFLMPG